MSNLLLSHALVHLEQGIGAFRLEIKNSGVWTIVKVKMDQEGVKKNQVRTTFKKMAIG